MWKKISFFLGCMALGLGVAHADYPDRSIRLIVPFPPGGVADTVARPIAEGLSKDLGVSVIVENKGGAGGAVGTGEASRARPDGYTLLFMLSSISILPEADKVLERDPAYRIDDFKPIARVTADPTVLVVRADAPWNTVEEFIQDAKNRPGEITYGSSGIYGSMHVPMAMLEKEADADIIETLRASMARVAADELTNQRIEAAGSPIEYMDADEFQVYWDADDIVLRQAVQDIGRVD